MMLATRLRLNPKYLRCSHSSNRTNEIQFPLQITRKFSDQKVNPRDYQYYDNFEVKEGVAILRLNGPGKMNTISPGLQEESEKIFREHIFGNKNIRAVVFISSKPDFIAGADIDMIKSIENKADLKKIIFRGHTFFDELKKNVKIPFVAAINGSCLGGGLEWAMYCDYRVATTSKKTSLGLPEVKLGLLPGMAGTYHLPKLIGYKDAVEMILTGKTLTSDKAKKIGLVDLVVDAAALERVSIDQAIGLAEGKVKSSKRKRDWMGWILEGNPIGRNFLFDQAKKTVDKSSGGKYPAPYKILEVLKNNYGKPRLTHLNDEAEKFSELAATPESAALIGLFQGSSAVKKHSYGKPAHDIQNIAVLGAGLMGAGIAEVSAAKGNYRVLLKDKDIPALARGEKMIADNLSKQLKKKKLSNYDFANITSRVIPLHDESESWKRHFGSADIVIEAVFEEIGLKHKVLREIEAVIPDHCIYATNTSAIPIARIAEAAKRPEKVIGMHYFSPVPLMPLLEIILHAGTAPEAAATAMEVGARQGKTPIFVKDVPGFYVNRCLGPFMSEVTALVLEGVDLLLIDKAMKDFGMPVGPITLCDEVGIDVSAKVGTFLANADLGVRMHGGNPELMPKLVEKGWTGRKSGKGFYLYPKDAKKNAKRELNAELLAFIKPLQTTTTTSTQTISVEDIQMRLISRFINEAAFSLQDEIIRSPVDGDIGAVFGIGFPPFLGGPFRMLDAKGTSAFVDRMYRYRDAKGPQFEPCQLLKDYAANGKKFHT